MKGILGSRLRGNDNPVMNKIKWLIVIAVVSVSGFLFWDDVANFSTKYFPEIKDAASELYKEEIKPQLSAPPPLRSLKDEPDSFLTRAGVIQWTNFQRAQNGLAALKTNQELNSAAAAKVEDMFQGQYFAHVAPDGKDATYFSQSAGYEAIAIGENLALGNFKDDQDLVQAWMDSPGHRANILNSGYQEIGAAVKRGTFEGKTIWLAVQIFGTPRSACPEPDSTLKLLIETREQDLKVLEAALKAKRSEIENTPKRDPSYNQKVAEYNAVANQYNSDLTYLKSLISQYNSQVKATNECISSF